MPCSRVDLETDWMELKHPGLASADPVLALPGGLCGRGRVGDGFCGAVLLTGCTVTWGARGMVLFLVMVVVDWAVVAGAWLAVVVKLSSTFMGTCFSVVCLLFGVMAPVVAGPVLSVSVFLSACSCSVMAEMLFSIAEAMVGVQVLLDLKQ